MCTSPMWILKVSANAHSLIGGNRGVFKAKDKDAVYTCCLYYSVHKYRYRCTCNTVATYVGMYAVIVSSESSYRLRTYTLINFLTIIVAICCK